jgi:NAD(P) transhydrogenase subunit alpha
MSNEAFVEKATEAANQARALSDDLAGIAAEASRLVSASAGEGTESALIVGLTVLVLAVFVGYHVVWRVTPALHSPLMAVTNAISSVIIVGALIAAGPADFSFSEVMGFLAVTLAAVNIFGGFIVTQRMLSMFKKKK